MGWAGSLGSRISALVMHSSAASKWQESYGRAAGRQDGREMANKGEPEPQKSASDAHVGNQVPPRRRKKGSSLVGLDVCAFVWTFFLMSL